MNKEIYCESCGCEIHDVKRCKMYRANCGPYHETIYICEDCSNSGVGQDSEDYGLEHVDMENGEAL